ncbi:MAG: hypothetical protein M1818_004057 [Claussenomyces sp. TS43310]|nr:MAG: hypothetical protein M1818_004057 [Claussenomyces sp. TS43310]
MEGQEADETQVCEDHIENSSPPHIFKIDQESDGGIELHVVQTVLHCSKDSKKRPGEHTKPPPKIQLAVISLSKGRIFCKFHTSSLILQIQNGRKRNATAMKALHKAPIAIQNLIEKRLIETVKLL